MWIRIRILIRVRIRNTVFYKCGKKKNYKVTEINYIFQFASKNMFKQVKNFIKEIITILRSVLTFTETGFRSSMTGLSFCVETWNFVIFLEWCKPVPGATKRCRLFGLTNSADVDETGTRGGGGGGYYRLYVQLWARTSIKIL